MPVLAENACCANSVRTRFSKGKKTSNNLNKSIRHVVSEVGEPILPGD